MMLLTKTKIQNRIRNLLLAINKIKDYHILRVKLTKSTFVGILRVLKCISFVTTVTTKANDPDMAENGRKDQTR